MNGGCTRCHKMDCECVLVSPRELAELREDVAFYREWSNELAMSVPEEYDDDVAQEAIISKWAKDMAAEVTRLRAQEEAVRELAEYWANGVPGQPFARRAGERLLAALDTEEGR